jgi:hypothetical protein
MLPAAAEPRSPNMAPMKNSATSPIGAFDPLQSW